ncbi:MAG: TM2 domain-containing protein [Clostridia bacterium]|nr:TM2 domain-containing protein [Clostridia bacterium]
MIYCSKCGNQVAEGNSFCPVCGNRFNARSAVVADKRKSKLAAGLLAIFIGALGVHNFYLGYIGKAIIQLLLSLFGLTVSVILTVVFAFIGLPFAGTIGYLFCLIPEIWAVIEGILILSGKINRDRLGHPLKD